jgi:RimJ/RimL family protein N-acetyltransferase
MTVLETTRLILRPPREGDRQALVAALNNFNISRWTGRIPHPYGPADADAFLESCRNLPADDVVLLITLGGEAIGVIGIERGELGYWLAEPQWGKGYATEAARAVTRHGFSAAGRESIEASYFVGNTASQHVLEKLGFEAVGTGTTYSRAQKTTAEHINLVLTRARWQQANPATRY